MMLYVTSNMYLTQIIDAKYTNIELSWECAKRIIMVAIFSRSKFGKSTNYHEVHRIAHHWPLDSVWILISLFMQTNHWILITRSLNCIIQIYIFFDWLVCHRLAQISFDVSKLGLYTDQYKALKYLRINTTVNPKDFKNNTNPQPFTSPFVSFNPISQ